MFKGKNLNFITEFGKVNEIFVITELIVVQEMKSGPISFPSIDNSFLLIYFVWGPTTNID